MGLYDKEIEEQNQEINGLKEKIKASLQDYIDKDSGIYHIYALYELAADFTANTRIDDCFFEVFYEVATYYFKGEQPLIIDDIVSISDMVSKGNMGTTLSGVYDAIDTYSPDFMHGIPKKRYLSFIKKLQGIK